MVKLFLAGFESRLSNIYTDLLKKNCKAGIVVSYLNMEKKGKSLEKFIEKLSALKKRGIPIMIDSGAHGLLYAYKKKKGITIEFGHKISKKAEAILENSGYENYFNEYIEFTANYQDIFDIIVELDIQEIVGKEIYKYRKKFHKVGIKPMYVWHGEDKEEVTSWIKSTDYIGIGGTEGDSSIFRKIKVAKIIKSINPNIKIHLFAETGRNIVKYSRWIDSADSSTWCFGGRKGLIYLYNKGVIKVLSKKSFYKHYGKVFDWRSYRIDRWNLLQWLKFADYLERINYEDRKNKCR